MLRHRLLDRALSHHLLPDAALLLGARAAAARRLRTERAGGVEAQEDRLRSLVWHLSHGPIAEPPETGGQVPAEFVRLFLGPRLKYSCALWQPGGGTLAQAEDAMLALTCERAQIEDGMDVLDLGCGWGSLTLWLAEHYPNARVTGVSASAAQRAHVEAEIARRGLANVELAGDDPGRPVDRVLSVETFEHMRNWKELLRRIAERLKPGGRAFVHLFSHRELAYRFEGTWAAERFFTGGTMPSHDLLLRFQDDLVVQDRWAVNGTHYERTLRAWLERLDANSEQALALLERGAGRREARRQLAAWRLFMISAAEIWGWRDGNEWLVSHYLLATRASSAGSQLTSWTPRAKE
jgi:cyclopropane-fatty-acyl-phospholipid synthase